MNILLTLLAIGGIMTAISLALFAWAIATAEDDPNDGEYLS